MVLTDHHKGGAVRRLKSDILKGRVVRKTEAGIFRGLVDRAAVAIVHAAVHTGNRDGLCGVCACKGVLLQKLAAEDDDAVLVGVKQVVRRVEASNRCLRGQTVRRIVAAPAQVHDLCRARRRSAECKCQEHQKCRDKCDAELFFHCYLTPFADAFRIVCLYLQNSIAASDFQCIFRENGCIFQQRLL